MKKTLFCLLLLLPLSISANIDNIDLAKLTAKQDFSKEIQFLKVNEKYVDHWSMEWNYAVSRVSLVKGLKNALKVFAAQSEGNLEQNLLLGDIALYLYNLNEQPYYEIAEKYYLKAIELAPNNYRPRWFIANLYANSNVQDKAIANFLMAQKILPVKTPATFWEQYAFAAATANMPSSCIYAMEQAKSILGHPSGFELKLGLHIHSLIQPVQSDSNYTNRDIWSYQDGKKVTFTSRPLGMKLSVEPQWQLDLGDFTNGKTAFTIVPDTAKNSSGTNITYTIAGIMKVTTEVDNLSDYVNSLMMDGSEKKRIHFTDKYPDVVAWEIKDKATYEDFGGAHMYLIGIKRRMPEYPGLLLEQPAMLQPSKSGEIEYFRASGSRSRFGGVIFYVFILDACEDIFPKADAVFRDFIEKEVTIE